MKVCEWSEILGLRLESLWVSEILRLRLESLWVKWDTETKIWEFVSEVGYWVDFSLFMRCWDYDLRVEDEILN